MNAFAFAVSWAEDSASAFSRKDGSTMTTAAASSRVKKKLRRPGAAPLAQALGLIAGRSARASSPCQRHLKCGELTLLTDANQVASSDTPTARMRSHIYIV